MQVKWCYLILLFLFVSGRIWGKGGLGHGADQMGAGGFSGPIHQSKTFINNAVDGVAGTVKGTFNELGEYGIHTQEATLAGLLQKEGIEVPKTRHFNVAKGASHRISTHELFFEGFSRRYLEAAKVANPNVSEEVLRKKIDNAFKTMKETLVTQYKDFYKVHSELAEKLAHQDLLIHFWGDYTTSNIVGLPDVEVLKKEFLKTVDGLWTPRQIKEFDAVVSNLMKSKASMNTIAEKVIDLTIQNGGTVNKVIMNVNGGKAVFKDLSQSKLQGIVRNVRWRLEAEMRQKALAYLDVNTLTPEDLYALDAIGPNPKAGKVNGKLFFSLLDENGLLEKYVNEGLNSSDLDKIAKSMADKKCTPSQIKYVVTHPDVKDGCSGINAIKRKAPTLKNTKKLNEYAKMLTEHHIDKARVIKEVKVTRTTVRQGVFQRIRSKSGEIVEVLTVPIEGAARQVGKGLVAGVNAGVLTLVFAQGTTYAMYQAGAMSDDDFLAETEKNCGAALVAGTSTFVLVTLGVNPTGWVILGVGFTADVVYGLLYDQVRWVNSFSFEHDWIFGELPTEIQRRKKMFEPPENAKSCFDFPDRVSVLNWMEHSEISKRTTPLDFTQSPEIKQRSSFLDFRSNKEIKKRKTFLPAL